MRPKLGWGFFRLMKPWKKSGGTNPTENTPYVQGQQKDGIFSIGGIVSKVFFIFTPNLWGNDQIGRAYFSDGLVQPPTSNIIVTKEGLLVGIPQLLQI